MDLLGQNEGFGEKYRLKDTAEAADAGLRRLERGGGTGDGRIIPVWVFACLRVCGSRRIFRL